MGWRRRIARGIVARRQHGVEAARGALLALHPAALTLLATYPGRRAVALREGLSGGAPWQRMTLGLSADLAFLLPGVAASLALVWLLAAATTRRGPTGAPAPPRAGGRGPALAAAIAVVALWLYSVFASEFKLRQGLYPTLRDVAGGLSDRSAALGLLPPIAAERYRLPSLVCLAASLALLGGLARGAPAARRLSRAFVTGFAVAVISFAGVARAAVWLSPTLFPAVDDRDALTPPLAGLASSAAASSPRAALEARPPDRALTAAGARALGFGAAHAEAVSARDGGPDAPCGPHPLARDLPGAAAAGAQGSGWTRLAESFGALSRALFAAPRGPIHVLHVAVAGFRADDVSALNPAASPEVAPFASSLYAAARDREAVGRAAGVLAFPHAYQGGAGTAHAVSALLCGLGAAPYGLAIARDLGPLPLRCLPDVLADAGFATRVIHGASLSSDRLLEFFRYHGVATTQRADLPWTPPNGGWTSAPDRVVYDAALDGLGGGPGHRYTFVLAGTGHAWFDAPEVDVPGDIPAEVEARRDRALRAAGVALEDDRRRLSTVACADRALERLVQRIEASPGAAQTVLVISGDPVTDAPFVWRSVPDAGARARVPLVVYLPGPLLRGSAAPEAALGRLREARALAAETPISANDVPTLLLALLSASEPLASLPAAWRWHTMGGMVTSPDLLLPGRPASALWGIDASTRLFSVDRGALSPTALHELSPVFQGADDALSLGDVGGAVASFLGAFLRGHARRCPGAEHVRLTQAAARPRAR